MTPKLVIFVHGWSVRNTKTYGELPARLKNEALAHGIELELHHVYLGKYVSFRDEVRLEDISFALEAALKAETLLQFALASGKELTFITHSTGGPVVRDWWHRYYVSIGRPCPMTHLIMLAPANFGSALAQLGKGTVSRLKSWFEGVEPGQGVLDWLELGSADAWRLNQAWVTRGSRWFEHSRVFVFVLTGQSIDRSLYDHLNSYTDEAGSDGVVRVASANLNATYVLMKQAVSNAPNGQNSELQVSDISDAPPTAFAVLPGLAHSGEAMGIMRSVRLEDGGNRNGPHPTVRAVLSCLTVETDEQYKVLCTELESLTAETQSDEKKETVTELFLFERKFPKPITTQLIVRVQDEAGYPIKDFDFLLTACDPRGSDEMRRPSPNLLPEGFFIDRQRNRRSDGAVTYFLNYEKLRKAKWLGIRIQPRPAPSVDMSEPFDSFVHYMSSETSPKTYSLMRYLRPNATLMIDVRLKRIVRSGVFRLTTDLTPTDFTDDGTGDPAV